MSACYVIRDVRTGHEASISPSRKKVTWSSCGTQFRSYAMAANVVKTLDKDLQDSMKILPIGSPREVWVVRNSSNNTYCGFVKGYGYVELDVPFKSFRHRGDALIARDALSIFRARGLYLDCVPVDAVVDQPRNRDYFKYLPENPPPVYEYKEVTFVKDPYSGDYVDVKGECVVRFDTPDFDMGRKTVKGATNLLKRLKESQIALDAKLETVVFAKVWELRDGSGNVVCTASSESEADYSVRRSTKLLTPVVTWKAVSL